MNKTTVKRGIGAVLLALIAAGLLAFLLKDKADQRQDIVDMPLPGSDETAQTATAAADGTTKLPQLSMDNNSGNAVNGSVIASAGSAAADAGEGVIGTATGAISASVAAVGDGVSGAVDAVTSAGESALDFSVRPPTTKSSEFRELSDVNLVNNGNEATSTATAAVASTVATAASTVKEEAVASKPATTRSSTSSNTTRGNVIASTSTRSSGAGEAQLIDERRAPAPRSTRTERVVSRQAASNTSRSTQSKPVEKKSAAPAAKPAPTILTSSSKNGYAIQLLATSSASRAKGLVDVMRKEGYKAYSTKVTQNGKLLYRVRIGQYASKASANNAHQAMKRRYKKNADVNRSAVVSR